MQEDVEGVRVQSCCTSIRSTKRQDPSAYLDFSRMPWNLRIMMSLPRDSLLFFSSPPGELRSTISRQVSGCLQPTSTFLERPEWGTKRAKHIATMTNPNICTVCSPTLERSPAALPSEVELYSWTWRNERRSPVLTPSNHWYVTSEHLVAHGRRLLYQAERLLACETA